MKTKVELRTMIGQHLHSLFDRTKFDVTQTFGECKEQEAHVLYIAVHNGRRGALAPTVGGRQGIGIISVTDTFVRAIFTPPPTSPYRKFSGAHDAVLSDPTSITALETLIKKMNDV
jgi:hypothetical protein